MKPRKRKIDRISQFVEKVHASILENDTKGMGVPAQRRRLRTITNACGTRATATFLRRLQAGLMQVGIHAEPALDDPGLHLNDWVRFSNRPHAPEPMVFPKEKYLQRFVQACLGIGPFRNLEPFRSRGRDMSTEYRLPDGRRIDLLCQERKRSGNGAIVAIELKRKHQRGTIEQMIEYLDALKLQFPSRMVKGIIISGREDRVAHSILTQTARHDIRWYRYLVTFEQLSCEKSAAAQHST